MNVIKLKPNVFKTNEEYKNKSTSLKIISENIVRKSKEKSFLHFSLDGISSKFEYFGLKIIYCDEPNSFCKQLLNDNDSYSKILINDQLIRNKDILYIDNFSKISDFLNNKKNGTLHEYLKNKDIFNNDLNFQNFLGKSFFDLKDNDIEEIINLDLENASLLSFMDIKNDYLNIKNFYSLLNIYEKSYTYKKLIILNDYDLISIEDILTNYLDKFNFIIVTSNLYKWINNINYLEFIVIINEYVNNFYKLDSLEIVDKKTLLKYLEKNKKSEKDKINKYIELLEFC